MSGPPSPNCALPMCAPAQEARRLLHQSHMLNLANSLTISRLVLAPVFIVFFLVDRRWSALCALGLAVVFEMTDLLDGYVARHFRQSSSLGKLIDPLADSVSRFSVFLAFTTEQSVRRQPWPVLLIVLIFYRDAIVAYTRTFAAASGVVLAARTSGKLKAVVQGTGILFFVALRAGSCFWESLRQYRATAFYGVMIPIVLVTVWSGLDYVRANWPAIQAMSRHKEQSSA